MTTIPAPLTTDDKTLALAWAEALRKLADAVETAANNDSFDDWAETGYFELSANRARQDLFHTETA